MTDKANGGPMAKVSWALRYRLGHAEPLTANADEDYLIIALVEAVESVTGNSCCEGCQEAKRVLAKPLSNLRTAMGVKG